MNDEKTPREIPTRRPFSSETEISLHPTRLGIRLRNVSGLTIAVVVLGVVIITWIVLGR